MTEVEARGVAHEQNTASSEMVGGHGPHEHGDAQYVRVWGILLALLAVSVIGPLLGVPWLTLITAFGIAVVKAFLVAKRFMHLDLEPRYVVYALATCAALALLFFAGTAPDVMRHRGRGWENLAAQAEVQRATRAAAPASKAPAPPAPAAPMAPELAFSSICASCHGAEGNGAGPAAVALDPKPANFQAPEFWQSRDVAHIAKVIRNGGASVGRSPLMPSFGGQFDEQAALALAEYVSSRFRPKGAAR
jgi:caa(3)-type oxidase subunit IV